MVIIDRFFGLNKKRVEAYSIIRKEEKVSTSTFSMEFIKELKSIGSRCSELEQYTSKIVDDMIASNNMESVIRAIDSDEMFYVIDFIDNYTPYDVHKVKRLITEAKIAFYMQLK